MRPHDHVEDLEIAEYLGQLPKALTSVVRGSRAASCFACRIAKPDHARDYAVLRCGKGPRRADDSESAPPRSKAQSWHQETGTFGKRLSLFSLACSLTLAAGAQKLPTASRSLDLQAGGSFVYGHADYGTTLKGAGGFGTINFRPHLGVMLDFHQANGANETFERTYEIGVRYVRHYGRFDPYAKIMCGRGVFNFPPAAVEPNGPSAGNLAYNLEAIGGGVDYKLRRSIKIRGDYEYQVWNSGVGLPNGLTPWLASVGAAYHFH